MIEIESENHHSDAANRTAQSKDDTFKSAYYSGSTILEMYNLLSKYEIGIAGTLDNARFSCHSYSSISKPKGDTNLEIVKRVLAEFTGLYDGVKKPDIEILGNFVTDLSIHFLKSICISYCRCR